jgi:hypothetical protein
MFEMEEGTRHKNIKSSEAIRRCVLRLWGWHRRVNGPIASGTRTELAHEARGMK